MSPAPSEPMPGLAGLPGVRAAFLTRIPGVDVRTDRATAVARLQAHHEAAIAALGFTAPALAEQVHGDRLTIVAERPPAPAPAADALATDIPGVALGIHVADCAAIAVVDPIRRVIALLHSGRKGTELGILPKALRTLDREYGCRPADLIVSVSPCIRPPHYDVDFAATIAEQARSAGVGAYHDAGICTAANPERYYSYRREKGQTGRMLALLQLDAPGAKLEV